MLGIGTNKTRFKYCTSDYFNWRSFKNYAFGSCSYLKKSRQESKSRWSYWIPSKFDVAHHNESFKPKRSSKKKKKNSERQNFLPFYDLAFLWVHLIFTLTQNLTVWSVWYRQVGSPSMCCIYKVLLVVSWKMNVTLREGCFVNNKWL